MRKLIIEDEDGQSSYELVDEVTIIGRDASCDLVLADSPGISRRHLKITRIGTELLAEDLGSSNGSELNGEPIEGLTELHSADVISVGDIRLHVDEAASRPAAGAIGVRSESTRDLRQRADARKKKSSAPLILCIVGLVMILAWVFRPDSLKSNPKPDQDATTTAENDEVRDENAREGAGSGNRNTNRRGVLDADAIRESNRRIAKLEEVRLEIEERLIQKDYLGAAGVIEAFETAEGGIAATQRRKLAAKMDQAAKAIRLEYETHRREGRGKYALTRLEEQSRLFPEDSDAYRSLENLVRAAGAVAGVVPSPSGESNSSTGNNGRGASNSGKPPVAVDNEGISPENAKESFYLERPAADTAFKERRYAQAHQLYGALAAKGRLARIKGEELYAVERRQRLSRRFARMRDSLETLINADPYAFTGVPVGGGRRMKAFEAKKGKVSFREGTEVLEREWKDLSDEAMLTLINKAKPDGIDAIDAGAFAMIVGRSKRGHALLRAGEKSWDELAPQVQEALADAMGIQKPQNGFVWVGGEYLTARNVARVDAREAIEKALKDLNNSNAQKRKDAYLTLSSLGARAASAFHRGLLDAKSATLKKLESNAGFQGLRKLKENKTKLEELRSHALALIFDEYEYPYPYRGIADASARHSKANAEIKLRVKPIREIWEKNDKVSLSPELRGLIALIDEYNEQLDTIGIGRGGEDPDFIDFLPEGKEVTLQTFADTLEERERIDTSLAWMEENSKKESVAKAIERQQVEITNQYRMMMGRHAVQVCDNLILAARMHSEDMSKQGFFAHENPTVPHKRSPSDRMRWVGFYGVGGSENIYAGGSDPRSAHNGWITSSGHHRNILGRRWRLLGSGQDGRNWTQNFSIREWSDAERERAGLPKGGLRTQHQEDE